MAALNWNTFKSHLLKGNIDFVNDTLKVALTTSTFVPNIDTEEFFNQVTNEVVGTGYTAGGQTLTTPAVTTDDTNDRGEFDADDVTWSSSTITGRIWILYVSGATPGTNDYLIGYEDMGSDKSSSNGDFTIQWNAAGIQHIT